MFQMMRRYLLILALGLWLGGFTFYTAIVIPAAHDVLGDEFQNGLVTRSVTEWLNWIGIVTIGLMFCDGLASCHKGYRLYTAFALSACFVAAASQVGLFIVHPRLDSLIDFGNEQVIDADAFLTLHRIYKQISSVQWVTCVGFLGASLLNWRWIDSRAVETS